MGVQGIKIFFPDSGILDPKNYLILPNPNSSVVIEFGNVQEIHFFRFIIFCGDH